jgi:uncharacterized protein YwgA
MGEGERAITLGIILKKIGNLDINTFKGRLVLQKKIYLLQSFGFYLGYKFSWYIHGPYSPDLTRDAFRLQPIYAEVPEVKFSNQEIEKCLNKFKRFIGDKENDADWLEQLACTHFLKALNPKADRDTIVKTVLDHEHYFKRKECEEAWDYLRQQNLVE